MRKDSIVEFEKGNRQDLVEQNKKEIEILNKYMPEQLSMEEINKIIDENLKEQERIQNNMTDKLIRNFRRVFKTN